MTIAHDAVPIRVVFVGGGPRAVMLLERLIAHLGAAAPDLQITIVEPHPPGPGRIWRRGQSPLLKLNSMARDVSVFTDDTCTLLGPVRPGPSLIEWSQQWCAGSLPDVVIDDELVRAELEGLREESFPTRRLLSYYLDWFWRTTVAAAPHNVTVRWHRCVVRSVRRSGAGYEAGLTSGETLAADLVVYCVGHNGREPAGVSGALIDEAAHHGLTYLPPDFTADADVSRLEPGQDVIVRGLGLAAVDLIVLLGEGRGGGFIRDEHGTLHYEPSGREPRLHLGSRRGVPYRSKVSSAVQGEAPRLDVLTAERLAALLARPTSLDFEDDLWPLITQELVWAHYRELFTGHPHRVADGWENFQDVLRVVAADETALRHEVSRVVPDPLDRYDVPGLDRPLATDVFANDQELQDRIRRHITEDLELRTTQARSSAAGLFHATLLVFMALAEVPRDRWTARSRVVSLPAWQRFFSYIASGPPAHRLEELLALSRAGVVRFLGPDVTVRIDSQRGFVASSRNVPGETTAQVLVDAWLPESGAAVSDNTSLRELALVHGRELSVADDSFAGSLGLVEVEPDGRVIGTDATVQDDLFAIGPFTSLTEAGAFTRPRSDSLSFRQTDSVAGAIAARLRILALLRGTAEHEEPLIVHT